VKHLGLGGTLGLRVSLVGHTSNTHFIMEIEKDEKDEKKRTSESQPSDSSDDFLAHGVLPEHVCNNRGFFRSNTL